MLLSNAFSTQEAHSVINVWLDSWFSPSVSSPFEGSRFFGLIIRNGNGRPIGRMEVWSSL